MFFICRKIFITQCKKKKKWVSDTASHVHIGSQSKGVNKLNTVAWSCCLIVCGIPRLMVSIYEPVSQFNEIAKRRYNLELEGVKAIKKHLSMKS